jgi:hypothetical protein
MDLETALLHSDLERIMSAVDDLKEIAGDVEGLLENGEYHGARRESQLFEHEANRLARDLREFQRRWKELRTANASPKARKRSPEAKKKP